MQLQGKTVLIPGAARPIGRAIARRFADEGARLVLPHFDWPEANQQMEEEFTEKKTPFLSMAVDLRAKEQVEALIQATKKAFGSLDILINNIERGGMPIVHGSYDHAHNEDQWDLEMATTLKAKWLLFHHGLPLLQQADGGAVVNISSIAGLLGRSGPGALLFNDGYSAANRAVSSFTETWAREAAPTVRVNELMLGLIQSRHGEQTRGWSLLSTKEQEELYQQTLLKRTGTPEEVAQAVLFLVKDAHFMTGATLRMDGGFVLGGASVPPLPPGILHEDS